jgi:hypothetical protein
VANLGEFGRAVVEHTGEPDTFTFYGERFEVPARLSPLPMMQFAWRTKLHQQADEQSKDRVSRCQGTLDRAPAGPARDLAATELAAAELADNEVQINLMAAMYEFMRGCLPNEAMWQRFQQTAMVNGAAADELMEICSSIFAAVSGRPTSRPSDSSDGPSSIGDGWTDGAGSPDPTAGQPVRDMDSVVVELTPLERQRREALAQMVPVGQLLRGSGG